MATDNDGWWDNGRDEGLRFDGDDATAAVLRLAPPAGEDVRGAFGASARTVFDRTSEALGDPRPPVPKERHWYGPLQAVAVDTAEGKLLGSAEGWARKRLGWKPGGPASAVLTAIHPF
jgi:hypothetical protein